MRFTENLEGFEQTERVLCLGYNTLFLHSYGAIKYLRDYILKDEVEQYDDANTFFNSYGDEAILRLAMECTSKNSLSMVDSNISDDHFNKILNSDFQLITKLSPVTNGYKMVELSKHLKFINKVIIAFPESIGNPVLDEFDDIAEYIVISDKIEDLEQVINENKITCLMVDDLKIIRLLHDRKNIRFENMSILIPRLGYNYTFNEEGEAEPNDQNLLDMSFDENYQIGFYDVMELTSDHFANG
jgi:hypothetical protein